MLEPYQWMGVCLTLISIYLVNQRDTLAKLLQPKISESETPASVKLLEPSKVELAELPIKIPESESEIWG